MFKNTNYTVYLNIVAEHHLWLVEKEVTYCIKQSDGNKKKQQQSI